MCPNHQTRHPYLEADVKVLLTIVLVLSTLGPLLHAQGTATPTADKIILEFADLLNARDLTKLASLYADDAVWMPANSPMIKGLLRLRPRSRSGSRGRAS